VGGCSGKPDRYINRKMCRVLPVNETEKTSVTSIRLSHVCSELELIDCRTSPCISNLLRMEYIATWVREVDDGKIEIIK
jgi:hypothetical protein